MTDQFPERESSDFILSLADKVRAGVAVNYGEVVTMGDSQILPVSMASFGFGGGSGFNSEKDEKSLGADGLIDQGEKQFGTGGGGGGCSIPVGAYISRDGKVTFEPNPVVMAVVSLPLACIAGRILLKLVKAKHKRK